MSGSRPPRTRRPPPMALFAAALIVSTGLFVVLVDGPKTSGPEEGGGPTVESEDLASKTLVRLGSEAEASGDPPDPWVLAHLLLALPGDATAASSTLADRLIETWGTAGPNGTTFPLHRASGRGEQHPDLVLKVLVEVADERGVGPSGARLEPIVRAAMARFRPPNEFRAWNDVAWLLQALATLARDGTFGVEPSSMLGESGWTLERLAVETLAAVERLDGPVEAALGLEPFARPSGNAAPDVAGMWAATCGGQHLLQAVVVALRDGVLPAEHAERVAARVEVLRRRVEAEHAFREDESRRAAERGISATVIARRRAESLLKLHGHALETFDLALRSLGEGRIAERDGREARWRTFLATEIERVEELLTLRLTTIDPNGTVVPKLRVADPLQWEFWFGDGCHALHGLRRARVLLGGPPERP